MPLTIIRGPHPPLAPLEPLCGKTVAVIGYGNQGRAHALNLRDSNINVIVAARRDGPGFHRAAADGFEPQEIEPAVKAARLVILALPDEVQPDVFQSKISPNLTAQATVGFIHGFNIRFGFITPERGVGAVMVAPKGPGQTLRERFVLGQGIPCLFAVHQESSAGDAQALGLAWANGIGSARAGIIMTTFRDETDTDLFGEQAVLCGGMTQLILAAFDTLVAAGYPPELAYLECCHEVKQIADLVYERGLAAMMQSISNTAEFGAYRSGPVLIDEGVGHRMQQILSEVQSGAFARSVRSDFADGFHWFHQKRDALRRHPIEQAGRAIRALLPCLATRPEEKK